MSFGYRAMFMSKKVDNQILYYLLVEKIYKPKIFKWFNYKQ